MGGPYIRADRGILDGHALRIMLTPKKETEPQNPIIFNAIFMASRLPWWPNRKSFAVKVVLCSWSRGVVGWINKSNYNSKKNQKKKKIEEGNIYKKPWQLRWDMQNAHKLQRVGGIIFSNFCNFAFSVEKAREKQFSDKRSWPSKISTTTTTATAA